MKSSSEMWAIIPTRGGSTRLPEKNIRSIAGRPLLHYMLESAKGTQLLNRIVLTTDSDTIAQVANRVTGTPNLEHSFYALSA